MERIIDDHRAAPAMDESAGRPPQALHRCRSSPLIYRSSVKFDHWAGMLALFQPSVA
jgi:hypothetical protein